MPAVNSKPKAIVEVPLPRGSKLPKGVVSQARKILRSASVGAAKWELLLLFAIFTMHNKGTYLIARAPPLRSFPFFQQASVNLPNSSAD